MLVAFGVPLGYGVSNSRGDCPDVASRPGQMRRAGIERPANSPSIGVTGRRKLEKVMRPRLIVIAVLAFVIGGLVALLALPAARERLLPSSVSVGKALVGGPFTLTDHTGRRVTEKDFRGRYMLVLFGFTYCPDICPSGLQVMSAALEQLGTKADRIVPVFVSVDHERDTPEQLALYIKSFHPRLIGLSGSAEEVAAAAKAYRVYFKKVVDEKTTAGFTYDHSALIYLMGPDGNYVAHFSHAASPDSIAARLAQIL